MQLDQFPLSATTTTTTNKQILIFCCTKKSSLHLGAPRFLFSILKKVLGFWTGISLYFITHKAFSGQVTRCITQIGWLGGLFGHLHHNWDGFLFGITTTTGDWAFFLETKPNMVANVSLWEGKGRKSCHE